MADFDGAILKVLHDLSVLQPDISNQVETNDETGINSSKLQIIQIYNNFIDFCIENFNQASVENQEKLKQTFIDIRDICIKYGTSLKFHVNFPRDIKVHLDEKHFKKQKIVPSNGNMSAVEAFYTLCAKTINKNFDGNFDSLRSFVNSIKLLKSLAGSDEDKQTALTTFVMTKMEQKALEKIPDNPEGIDAIIKHLTEKIKPSSSKVVSGQMIALSIDNRNVREFQKEAENLAEQFQRALVAEKIPLDVATKMTVEKTVELCRRNAKSVEVKAVLNAAHFETPADVVAKMATTIDSVRQDNATKEPKKFNNQKPGRFINRKFGQNRNGPNFNTSPNAFNNNRPNHNFRNNGNNGHQGHQGQRHYTHENNRGSGYNSGYSGGRGRGGYHNNNNTRTVHFISGNEGIPLTLGGFQQAQQHQQSPQNQ